MSILHSITSIVRCVVRKNGLAFQDNVAAVDVGCTCKQRARVGLRPEKPYPFTLRNDPFSENTRYSFASYSYFKLLPSYGHKYRNKITESDKQEITPVMFGYLVVEIV